MADIDLEAVEGFEEELNRISVEKLRKILKSKGLSTHGKKKVLIKRLIDAFIGMKSLKTDNKSHDLESAD